MSFAGLPPSSPTDLPLFRHAALSHVELQVADAATTARSFADFGFHPVGATADGSLALQQGDCRLRLTQAAPGSDASRYVAAHGDGVADIALGVADAEAAFSTAVARGAVPVTQPLRCAETGAVTASIAAFGDVVHSFVQPGSGCWAELPRGFRPSSGVGPGGPPADARLTTVDHFAVCLEPGGLDMAVAFYRQVLGFRVIFEERIEVGAQAMLSAVVQNDSRQVTLTLIQPDPAAEPGQIDAFLAGHGGPGVQHIAFASNDIVHTVERLQQAGVAFLDIPGTYYDRLRDRIGGTRHDLADLRRLRILADQDHDGQLFRGGDLGGQLGRGREPRPGATASGVLGLSGRRRCGGTHSCRQPGGIRCHVRDAAGAARRVVTQLRDRTGGRALRPAARRRADGLSAAVPPGWRAGRRPGSQARRSALHRRGDEQRAG